MKEVVRGVSYGEVVIVCLCDQCGEEYHCEVDDSIPDFGEAQAEIEKLG